MHFGGCGLGRWQVLDFDRSRSGAPSPSPEASRTHPPPSASLEGRGLLLCACTVHPTSGLGSPYPAQLLGLSMVPHSLQASCSEVLLHCDNNRGFGGSFSEDRVLLEKWCEQDSLQSLGRRASNTWGNQVFLIPGL